MSHLQQFIELINDCKCTATFSIIQKVELGDGSFPISGKKRDKRPSTPPKTIGNGGFWKIEGAKS